MLGLLIKTGVYKLLDGLLRGWEVSSCASRDETPKGLDFFFQGEREGQKIQLVVGDKLPLLQAELFLWCSSTGGTQDL